MQQNRKRRWLIIAVILVIVVVVIVTLLSGPVGVGSPKDILVSGSASIVGVGSKTPTSINFRSSSGSSFNTTVSSGGLKTGSYSIRLPNGQTYAVVISFGGPFGALGHCLAGNLSLSQGFGMGNLTRNFSC